MNTSTIEQTSIIDQLNQRIADELTPIDREEHFRRSLDGCFSFEKVGGPFAHMQPSAVLEECDPIAFRCGVNDYADGENWVEVNGETYDQDECEKTKEELISELESRVSDLEAEIGDENGDGAHQEELAELNENLRLLNCYSF